eukprot:3776621-Prymnesium_polylepis.1
MAAEVTFAEQPSESGEMGSCGRLPRSRTVRVRRVGVPRDLGCSRLSTRDGGRGDVEMSIKPCETYDTGRSEWEASAGRVTTPTQGNSSSPKQERVDASRPAARRAQRCQT